MCPEFIILTKIIFLGHYQLIQVLKYRWYRIRILKTCFGNIVWAIRYGMAIRRFNLVHFCLKSQTENSRYQKYKWPEFVSQLDLVKHVRTS